MKEAFKGYTVMILDRVIGQYNSKLDIDQEHHRRPKDKIPWILIGIYLTVPAKLSSLKAKDIDFPFFGHFTAS